MLYEKILWQKFTWIVASDVAEFSAIMLLLAGSTGSGNVLRQLCLAPGLLSPEGSEISFFFGRFTVCQNDWVVQD